MSRRLLIVAVALPLVGAAVAYGCSDEPAIESLCGWVSDPGNCYRFFREDMKATGATDCKPKGDATPVGTKPSKSNGAFLKRGTLDTCILDQGGSVKVDPPIDLTKIPADPLAQPITYTLTFTDDKGVACGNATYTSPHGFSITINAPADAGVPMFSGSGGGSAVTPNLDAGADAGIHYPFGTFSEVNQPGRDTIDTTCPSGESHHFVLDETNGPPGLDGGAVSACPAFKDLVPEAFLLIDPGGTNVNGAVSFSIVYPPINRSYPANLDPSKASPYVAPDVVTYFNCSIPGAPPACQNGVVDGSETDIDCGGPITDLNNFCPARCQPSQLCLCDLDCAAGVCSVDSMTGMRVCSMPGAGGIGRHCPYTLPANPHPDAGAGAGGSGGATGTGGSGGATGTGGAAGSGGATSSTGH